ncbi:hypothetical protein G3O08_08305 [Cryomorpha ignava]|uniref:Transporter n=1 Tax=Cryomorpha ignava TaxID=101383 RepID=A0A7K3WRN7_9FLAO|nr:outer membrane protein transport protein [Cryomorpha ignava]NEN23502.1 hypothetical protein [Cryomorpha ignava]
MKRFIFSSVSILLGLAATAQNDADVLRYSSQYVLGTARFSGLGGAMGALGGDMSATHINPASIALYRFGDISFTPSMEFNVIESELNGNTASADQNKLVINNIGFVLANETKDPYWKSVNFGVSYNRLNTFNDNLVAKSTLPVGNSMMQDFANQAYGYAPGDLSEFSSLLAYNSYVIDRIDTINDIYDGRAFTGDLTQFQNAERSGRLSETSLNFGANYNDKVYIGASLNFQSPYYKSKVETTETPLDVANTDLVKYTYSEILETTGLGFNFKLGGIVKAGDYLRFGASVQTPTTFTLTDNYRTKLTSELREPSETFSEQSSLSVFEYRVRTPWRFMGSIAGILGKKGLVSFQYEFADFSGGKLKNASSYGSNGDFSDSNESILKNFSISNIYRAGAEYRFTNEFYGRAGFAYFSNPNRANEFTDADLNRYQYSGGLGYRAASWSLDMTYQLAKFQEVYQTNNSADITTLSNNLSSIILTLGFRL